MKKVVPIAINANLFFKDFFLDESVKLFLGSTFRNWVLRAVPDAVPAFQGTLLRTQLTKKYMYDSAILEELGNPRPFTILEFVAIIRDLFLKQPNGKEGALINNGHANIFFVQLGSRVVTVYMPWDSAYYGWFVDVFVLGVGRWRAGSYVFSLMADQKRGFDAVSLPLS